MKKGTALLIVLLFIAIFGGIATTMTRAGLLNGIFASKAVAAVIAEEASQAGLEVGLLDFKNNGVPLPGSPREFCVNLDDAANLVKPGSCNLAPTIRWANVKIESTGSNNAFVKITSTGRFGYVIKKHSLTQKFEIW